MTCESLVKKLRERGENIAADVIEKLMEERQELLVEHEALMSAVKGKCEFCTHRRICMFGNHMRDICVNGSKWEWRGTMQKE